MIQTLNKSMFMDAFRIMNRQDNFSYDTLSLLFDYFEEIDENMELDVIAVCCDYSESTVDELIANYDIDISESENKAEQHAKVSDYLNDHTILIGETGNESYVYANF